MLASILDFHVSLVDHPWRLIDTHLRLTCRWKPKSFWARAHARHCARRLYCYSAIELVLRRFQRFFIPAHCRVELCHRPLLNSSKTIWYLGLCEMWQQNPVATFVCLAQCRWLLLLMNLPGWGFLLIEIRQQRLGCQLRNGSRRIFLSSAQIANRSPSSWCERSPYPSLSSSYWTIVRYRCWIYMRFC